MRTNEYFRNKPTKESLRMETWKKMEVTRSSVAFFTTFNRNPRFVGSDKAARLLSETIEFMTAKHIKADIDRSLHDAKMQVILNEKTLYLSSFPNSSALFLKVLVPPAATIAQVRNILEHSEIPRNRMRIFIGQKIKLDMVLIGSVIVSRDGYRIGRGNGSADLDIAILIDAGCITPNTVIVTMVHDVQVVDTLPKHIFKKHDTPVDMIITPTEVIRVAQRLPRPAGVYWDLLQHRSQFIPVLHALRDRRPFGNKANGMLGGNNNSTQPSRRRRRRSMIRRNQLRATHETLLESQNENKAPRTSRRRRRNRRRAVEQVSKINNGQNAVEPKKPTNKRTRSDFSIVLSNISRAVRVRDLKSELRKREIHPLYITWRGTVGKCFLHFGNRTGTPSTDDDIEKVVKLLDNLSLTGEPDDQAVTYAGVGDGGAGGGGDKDSGAGAGGNDHQPKINIEVVKLGTVKGKLCEL